MRCVVPNCINNINDESRSRNNQQKSQKSAGLSFHTIPTDKFVRPHWLKALQITEDDANRFDKNKERVCSSHFMETCFFKTSNGRKLLIVGSVPSLNLDNTQKYYHNDHIYCAESVDDLIIQSDDEEGFIIEEIPMGSYDVGDFETSRTLKIEKLEVEEFQSSLLIEKIEPKFDSTVLIEACDLKIEPIIKSNYSDFEDIEENLDFQDYDYDFLEQPSKSSLVEIEISPSPEFINKKIIQSDEIKIPFKNNDIEKRSEKFVKNDTSNENKNEKSKSGVIYLDKTNRSQNDFTQNEKNSNRSKSKMFYVAKNIQNNPEKQSSSIIINSKTNINNQITPAKMDQSQKNQDAINDKKKIKKFECHYCGVKYRRNLNLREHLFSHTGVKPFKCNICSKSFTRKHMFKSHRLLHTGLGKKSYKCFFCTKEFNYRIARQRHEKKEHAGSDSLVCIFCDQTFKGKGPLVCHEYTHTGLNAYDKCTTYLMKKYEQTLKNES